MFNLDGLTIVGQGSEWFWSMAQLLLLAVTFVVIYRQLRAQGATNVVQRMDSLVHRWGTGEMTHAQAELALHLKYEGIGTGTWIKAFPILNFIDEVGRLQRDGHMSLDEVSFHFGYPFPAWWTLLAPHVEQMQARYGPAIYAETKRLMRAMTDLDAQAGTHFVFGSPETILDTIIAVDTEQLRQHRDYVAGVIPSGPVAQPAKG